MSDDIKPNEIADPFTELAPHLGNTPVASAHAIAAIALSMSMKYHDIQTVKDGALYQQYKLEGKNFRELHIDHVFETAERIEFWLLGASERIAKLIMDAVVDVVDDKEREAASTTLEHKP
jgi:hypothetical protein